ncbi:MAG: sodium:glutamate symporter, partial [Spirochaetia bacterium]
MTFSWSIFIDLGIVAAGLLAATALRARVRLLQRFLVPNALTAGLLLLPFYNYVLPHLGVTTANLQALTYHLLSIAFVAMAIRPAAPAGQKGDGRIFATSVAIIGQFAIQSAIGLLLTLGIITFLMPDLYHSFGFLLPLGFSQGPGQALSIGEGWRSMGVVGAGSVGLTFAAVGFLIACFGGVFLINYGIRHGWVSR